VETDFHGFVDARSAALFRGALVLTGNRHAAEDLVQETLERACRKWRHICAKDAPDAYVRRIMVNLANDRRRRFRRAIPVADGPDRTAPGDRYQQVDSRDQLVRALQQLPMRMRTVVVLRYFHDLSDDEIAADLDISASTVPLPARPGDREAQRPVPRTLRPFTTPATGRNPMNWHDAGPSGCTPFEQELVNAMNNYADSADAPEFDAPGIVRRTRRRRAVGIAAVATALIVAGGGTALAAISGGTTHKARPAASSTAAKNDATTMLLLFSDGTTLPIEFGRWDLDGAKAYLQKNKQKLGTVTEKAAPGCKPGQVIGLSPHTPKTAQKGDTISFTICAG